MGTMWGAWGIPPEGAAAAVLGVAVGLGVVWSLLGSWHLVVLLEAAPEGWRARWQVAPPWGWPSLTGGRHGPWPRLRSLGLPRRTRPAGARRTPDTGWGSRLAAAARAVRWRRAELDLRLGLAEAAVTAVACGLALASWAVAAAALGLRPEVAPARIRPEWRTAAFAGRLEAEAAVVPVHLVGVFWPGGRGGGGSRT